MQFMKYRLMNYILKMETNINGIEFETTQLLETISCYDQVYSCIGYDKKGWKYEAVALVSCGEIVGVTDIKSI